MLHAAELSFRLLPAFSTNSGSILTLKWSLGGGANIFVTPNFTQLVGRYKFWDAFCWLSCKKLAAKRWQNFWFIASLYFEVAARNGSVGWKLRWNDLTNCFLAQSSRSLRRKYTIEIDCRLKCLWTLSSLFDITQPTGCILFVKGKTDKQLTLSKVNDAKRFVWRINSVYWWIENEGEYNSWWRT